MSIERRLSDFEKALILTPIRKYIEATYNIDVVRNDTIGLKPPYIIVGNHVTNWDPFFINCYVDEPMCFVAAAPVFRHPVMKTVMEYVGAISKTKSRADSSTVRNLIRAKKANRVIGLFPEGNRTWNGQTEPIVYATAKLIQSLNIPIVVATIQGGYLSHPRWATSVRKGKVTVCFTRILEGQDVKKMPTEDVHAALTEALAVNDFDWQRETGIRFTGKQLAHYLERYLFACPHCESVGQLHSQGDHVLCKTCSYEVRYTETGLFERVNYPVRFARIDAWNTWQQHYLRDEVTRGEVAKTFEVALQDEVKLAKGPEAGPLTELGIAHITCVDHQFIVQTSNDKFELDIANLQSISVHKHHKIDFYYEQELYHLQFTRERANAFMWYSYLQEMKAHIHASSQTKKEVHTS